MKPETYIQKYSASVPAKELARRLGRSGCYVLGVQKRLGCRPPKRIRDGFAKAARFAKGCEAHNKGKAMSPETRAKLAPTWFKKGNLPHNTKKDNQIVTRPDGRGVPYKFIRVSLGNWQAYHVYRWEKFRGPVPDGHIVRFINGNTLDCRLANLEVISKAENADRNRWGSREILETRRIIKKLNSLIDEKQNQRS